MKFALYSSPEIRHYIFVATCPPLNITNGRVEYHPSAVNGALPIDTLAFFTCDEGYIINGFGFSTCQESGNWDPEIPTCDKSMEIAFH